MKATIYKIKDGNDTIVGTISLDDSDKLSATPSDNKLLNRIISLPVSEMGSGRDVDPKKEPRVWLTNLHTHYRSAYLRASKVEIPD